MAENLTQRKAIPEQDDIPNLLMVIRDDDWF